MNNVCRPIILYNVHVPAKEFKYEWQYTAFGIYDGIDIRDNVWQKETKSFGILMEELAKETLLLNGNFSKEVNFAIRSEVGEEEEEFWKDNSYPFIFLVSLYMNGRARDLKRLYIHMEDRINGFTENQKVKAICYQSLDNSDILLVMKAKNYRIGTDIINLFHDGENSFTYEVQEGCFEKISLHYSYSICGFDRKVKLEERYVNEKIKEVSFFAFEKKPGSILPFIKNLKRELKGTGARVINVELLGSNDEKIIIKNITWGRFLSLYQEGSPLLTNENDLYCSSICYGSTQLYHGKTERLRKDIFSRSNEGRDSEKLVTNEGCSFETERIQKLKEDAEKGEYNNARELEYMKAIFHIENAMQKFKDSEFPSYVYTAILQPMNLFIKQLNDFREGKVQNIEYCADNGIFDFLNAITIVIQSTSRVNRDFLQTPDFNVVINDVPIKLFAFYSAWVHKVTKILNTNNAETRMEDSKKKEYSVLICPGLEKFLEIEMIFPKFPPEDRLLLVKVPERVLYRPELLCIKLIHEIAHYVGDRIRKRETRYQKVLDIYSEIIIQKIKEFFEDYLDEKSNDTRSAQIRTRVKERAEYFIGKNKRITPKYGQYQYYTDFLKKVSDDILDELVREDLPLFCEEIRREHLIKNLSVSENKITAYDAIFVDKMLEENKKEKVIKEKAKKLVEFFELHKRQIIDNVNNLAKEIYADLICILLLEVPGEVYLKNIFNSLDELAEDKSREISLKDTIINIRAALIIQCMQVEKAKEVSFPYKWEKNLVEKTFKNNQGDSPFCEWLKVINHLLCVVKENVKGKKDYSYLLDAKVWDCFRGYLLGCRIEFGEWIESEETLKKEVEELKEIYKNMSTIQNLEKTILEIRNFVEQHKIELKSFS